VPCPSRRGRARTPLTGERSTIREARLAQNRAMAAGDADAAAAYWTDDVILRRGLGQAVIGRAAYRALLAPPANRDSAVVYQREPVEIEVSGTWPLAYESGTWVGRLGRAEGPEVVRGRYSAQWVRRDGRWLIRAEVFVALTCSGIGCGYAAAP
jgi:ketosteroid isomerase-like protein